MPPLQHDVAYIINPTPVAREGMHGGARYKFLPGMITVINGWSYSPPEANYALPVPAEEIAQHLLQQLRFTGIEPYDPEEAMKIGRSEYNREVQIRGLVRFLEGVDGQIEAHNRSNDERIMRKLSPIGDSPSLRVMKVQRKAVVKFLEEQGVDVAPIPSFQIPDVAIPTIGVSVSRPAVASIPTAGPANVLDPGLDMPMPANTKKGQRRPPMKTAKDRAEDEQQALLRSLESGEDEPIAGNQGDDEKNE